jgi:hypothetical protein
LNIKQILEDIDLLVPNAFSLDQKINWLNQAQFQIYKELESPSINKPREIQKDNLTFIPWLPVEYHELLSLGTAKRIAERTQDYQKAAELEARFSSLLLNAQENTSPKLKKVNIVRGWA